jgi:cyclopropane fatty-acyl-phospholipid synthase-like methyltransferase
MQKASGMSIFEYLSEHSQDASDFNEAMIGFHGSEPPAVAAAYDFSVFDTLVDVGGGTGNLLAAILQRYPKVRGILADLPHVVPEASALIRERGLEGRVTIEPVDFFESVPAGGDACLLSHVIHDWTEDQCITILSNCRKAMKSGGRLLIIEMVLPAGDTPHPGKLLDIAMLVMPGGQERTEEEYAALLSKAGFRLTRVVPTQSPVCVVEASPI